MYRENDIISFNNNIKKIVEDSSLLYKINNEPTFDEISKVYDVILKFIIKKKKIIYGGYAQNLLIKEKNPEDVFYKEYKNIYMYCSDIADLEFYSSNPLEDVIELCDELYKNNFKYIESKEGIHAETYKIFVNFIGYCDISYISDNIYNNIPTIKINNIICAHPNFMMIDSYRVFNDPMTSYWRLEKSFIRFNKIIKYYPFELTNKNIIINKNKELLFNNFNFKPNYKFLKFIKKKIIHKSKLIVIGFYAYNYYAKKSNKKFIFKKFPYYELISDDLKNDSLIILKKLKQFNNNIKIKQYYQLYEYFDNKIEYYLNNELILILYGNYKRCTVYNYSEKKKIYFGTFNLIIMYLLINYYYFIIIKNNNLMELYNLLYINLFELRTIFLNKNNITVIDNSLFQDFTLKCIGKPIEMKRQSMLSIIDKKYNKIFKFKYNPNGLNGKIPKFKFINKSGTEIYNKKNFIINKK
jgi:hypothetical protein